MSTNGAVVLADWQKNEILSAAITWTIRQVVRSNRLSVSEIRAETDRLIAFNRKAEAGRWHDEDSLAHALICLGMIPESSPTYKDSLELRRNLATEFESPSLAIALGQRVA